MSVSDEIEAFLRLKLAERLAQLSERQREFARRLFGDPVPTNKLESAIDVCDRTIKKNKADPSRLSLLVERPGKMEEK